MALGAEPFVPETRSLRSLAAAVDACRGCDLYRDATQAVFGRGPKAAPLLLVGEQPGDREDLVGRPFVGPAGAVLRKALEDAGVPLSDVYLTNAVKHFKHVVRGKRRIHESPNRSEIGACRPWILREIELVRPKILVCLGAIAARALIDPRFRLMARRGRVLDGRRPSVLATIHPSAVLRAPEEGRRRLYAFLVRDLETAKRAVASAAARPSPRSGDATAARASIGSG